MAAAGKPTGDAKVDQALADKAKKAQETAQAKLDEAKKMKS